tara:strand:+ start:192 stop:308 length:117 start_codon:yes stop_codon:yes gene_type:complete
MSDQKQISMMGQVRTSLYTLGATSKNSAVAAVKTDFGG